MANEAFDSKQQEATICVLRVDPSTRVEVVMKGLEGPPKLAPKSTNCGYHGACQAIFEDEL